MDDIRYYEKVLVKLLGYKEALYGVCQYNIFEDEDTKLVLIETCNRLGIDYHKYL